MTGLYQAEAKMAIFAVTLTFFSIHTYSIITTTYVPYRFTTGAAHTTCNVLQQSPLSSLRGPNRSITEGRSCPSCLRGH